MPQRFTRKNKKTSRVARRFRKYVGGGDNDDEMETFTLDQLLDKLNEAKEEHGGDIRIFIRDEYSPFGHQSISSVIKNKGVLLIE
jgi:hypothetical protein